MERIDKRITINAPLPETFRFLSEPSNLTRICPGIIEITDIKRLTNGGRQFHFVGKMVGARIECVSECIEYVVNHCICSKISGGLHGSVRWVFEPKDEHVEVTFQMEYALPNPLLRKHTQAAVIRQNEMDAAILLANLKAALENQPLIQQGAAPC